MELILSKNNTQWLHAVEIQLFGILAIMMVIVEIVSEMDLLEGVDMVLLRLVEDAAVVPKVLMDWLKLHYSAKHKEEIKKWQI